MDLAAGITSEAPGSIGSTGSTAATGTTGAPFARAPFAGVALCFFLSGFAALLYQTAWMRQFSIVFGTSELAIATVLAAYMAGLAAGAAIAGRQAHRIRRPVLAYGLLELGVALSALAVPLGLELAETLLASTIGGRPDLPDGGSAGQSAFYLIATFAVLILPTGFMGATLPLLTRHVVRTPREIGRRVGALYAINTLGAAVGTLCAAFALLPSLGLSRTVWVGVGVNALVFLIAAALARGAGFAPPVADEAVAAEEPLESTADARIADHARVVLPLMLVSGAASFTYEVLWTRMLSHLLGASVYAFATMLAAFLLGITAGSAIAAVLARSRRAGALGFVLAQLLTAGLSVLIFGWLADLPSWELARDTGEMTSLGRNSLIAGLVLLPATLSIGATFPFALRVLARDARAAGNAAGRVYAWNTLGAILGAILAGFFVIPALGFDGTVRAAVFTNVGLGVVGALAWLRASPVALVTSAAALVGAFLFQPQPPTALLRSSPLSGMSAEGEEVFAAVGQSASVLMLESEGKYFLRCNGLPESAIEPRGAPPFARNFEWWLAVLPVLARPATSSMLVIGFGGGVILEGVPPGVAAVDVIELEPQVIQANREIAELRERDPLADPRLRVFLNDARGALALTDRRYDAIVSQPSHPWTAGASHLYTREFLSQARSHLEPGGVFVQWMASSFLDEELLRMLGATLLDVFAHVRLYRPRSGMLVFLASDEPIEIEHDLLRDPGPIAIAADHYGRLGIHGVTDIAAALALDQAGLQELCRGAAVNTDDDNQIAMRSPDSLRYAKSVSIDELLGPLDPLRPGQPLARELAPTLDRGYLVQRLVNLGLDKRASLIARQTEDPSLRELTTGILRTADAEDTSRETIRRALDMDPANARARFTLVRPWLSDLASGIARPEIVEAAAGLEGSAAAVVDGWERSMQADWAGLAALEDALAQARPTDAWYVDAMRLRATWRCVIADPKQARIGAEEALVLIDRALALDPDPLALIVRARAALIAERPNVLVETLAELALLVTRPDAGVPPSMAEFVIANLTGYRPALQSLASDPRVHARRVEQVLARIDALVGPG